MKGEFARTNTPQTSRKGNLRGQGVSPRSSICESVSKAYLAPEMLSQPCSWLHFHNSRKQKQPKCPSDDGQIMKMCHIYTMKYHSAEKKSKLMKHTGKRMELENTIRREVIQTQIGKRLMFAVPSSKTLNVTI